MIYHITTADNWPIPEGASYYADSLETEGFIHASTAEQLVATANRFYASQEMLYLLCIEEGLLSADLRYEQATDVDDLFPHIFGAINPEAIVAVQEWHRSAEGVYLIDEISLP